MCIQQRKQLQWTNYHLHMMVAEAERDRRDETREERIRILCSKYAHRLKMLCAISIVTQCTSLCPTKTFNWMALDRDRYAGDVRLSAE